MFLSCKIRERYDALYLNVKRNTESEQMSSHGSDINILDLTRS